MFLEQDKSLSVLNKVEVTCGGLTKGHKGRKSIKMSHSCSVVMKIKKMVAVSAMPGKRSRYWEISRCLLRRNCFFVD